LLGVVGDLIRPRELANGKTKPAQHPSGMCKTPPKKYLPFRQREKKINYNLRICFINMVHNL